MIGAARHTVKTLRGFDTLSAAAWHTEAFGRKMSTISDSLQVQKKLLRRTMKAKLRQLSAEDMQRESEAAKLVQICACMF